MTERGMIFNGEMVRAILDSRKTQTRRPVKFPFKDRNLGCELSGNELAGELSSGNYLNSPFGKPGDRIWVRETFASGLCTETTIAYRATHKREDLEEGWDEKIKWTPSIHMPRWTSRILLEITDVRVERLSAISQANAIAEGAPPSHPSIDCVSQEYGFPDFSRSWFGHTWQHIYGEGSWLANPWVWVIEFKRIEGGDHATN
ncbi:ASCH domain-containing protein [Citrobacter freundii]|uniref:hypothetical protein n=1 Tax=Citrobacter freundii TaxID=546 RepID=UPI00292AE075|nr:hypothetical protein [Citrobacter freundii]MDV1744510.1 hypothetical protein [Citrobacter freundii]MEB0442289.1 hypothetical protein [Citrobacter freundii]